jgi:hypothetical protein
MLMILVFISLILDHSFVFLFLTLSSIVFFPSRINWACKHLVYAHQGDKGGATTPICVVKSMGKLRNLAKW